MLPGRFLLCYLVAPVFSRAEGCSDDHFTWETKRTTRLFLKRIGPSSPVFRRIKPASKINIFVAIPVDCSETLRNYWETSPPLTHLVSGFKSEVELPFVGD